MVAGAATIEGDEDELGECLLEDETDGKASLQKKTMAISAWSGRTFAILPLLSVFSFSSTLFVKEKKKKGKEHERIGQRCHLYPRGEDGHGAQKERRKRGTWRVPILSWRGQNPQDQIAGKDKGKHLPFHHQDISSCDKEKRKTHPSTLKVQRSYKGVQGIAAQGGGTNAAWRGGCGIRRR